MAIFGKKSGGSTAARTAPAKKGVKTKKGKSSAADTVTEDWYDDVAEVPRAELPENAANLSKRNFWRRVFMISAFAAPLALLLAFLSFGTVMGVQRSVERVIQIGTSNQQVESVVNRVTSPGRYAATQALQEWLDSVPSPLPGGSIQSWNGSTDVKLTIPSQNGSTPVQPIVTREQFTVVDGTGRGYTAEIQVATDKRGGSKAIAGPSLLPLPQPVSNAFSNMPLWEGVASDQQSTPEINAAVQNWASAYTSGDAAQLRLAVADPNAQNSYVPIAGVTKATSEVQVTGRQTRGEGNDAKTYVIARVQVSMNWLGRKDGQSPAPMVMDVLVENPDTASPRIVAWGAPGTGADLKPYQNAVPTENREAQPTLNPNQTTAPKQNDEGGIAPTAAPTQR